MRTALVLLLSFGGLVSAMFATSPEDVPLARLEENVKAYLAKNPDDKNAHYILGRLYCIAYATNAEVVSDVTPGSEAELPDITFPSISDQGFLPKPSEASREDVRKRFDERPSALSPEDEAHVARLVAAMDQDDVQAREKAQADLSAMGTGILPTLRKALEGKLSLEQKGRVEALVEALERSVFGVYCLKKAIEQYQVASTRLEDPALAWLGLGWCWEEAGHAKEALEAYRNAFDRGVQKDLAAEDWSHYSGAWHGSAALEAGERILALSPPPATDEEKKARAGIEEQVAKLREMVDNASQWITPIVVPLGDEGALEELLDPTRVVTFDLVGDGRARRWPWVRGTTGILAWDPRGTGRIERAQQLFGSYTWSIPWRSGYEPLSWLDDDGDGRLRGRELAGLVVWRDADQDGVSGPGEVASLAAWGIRSLGVRGTTWCPDGVERSDGDIRPTWDWMPRSVR